MELLVQTIMGQNSDDESDEYFCSTLFDDYVKDIENHGLIYDAHKDILNNVYQLSL